MKKKLLLALLLILLAAVAYVAAIVVTVNQGGALYQAHWMQLPGEEQRVALTFDDGPNPGETEQLLDLLDQLSVKATFFVNGKHVEQHPELIKEMHRRGHAIGNHGWSHRMLYQLGTSIPMEELVSTNAAIEKAIGSAPTLFRAPFLVSGRGLTQSVTELGMQPVGGLGTNDWEELDPAKIADAILTGVTSGSIILLHDGDGGSTQEQAQNDRQPTVRAVEIIIKRLHEQGYRFVHPDELHELGRQS